MKDISVTDNKNLEDETMSVNNSVEEKAKLALRKDGKRPELQLYRPGMGLAVRNIKQPPDGNRSNHPDGEEFPENKSEKLTTVSLKTWDTEVEEKINNLDISKNETQDSSLKKQQRRPDQAVYIPKQRGAASQSSPYQSENETKNSTLPSPGSKDSEIVNKKLSHCSSKSSVSHNHITCTLNDSNSAAKTSNTVKGENLHVNGDHINQNVNSSCNADNYKVMQTMKKPPDKKSPERKLRSGRKSKDHNKDQGKNSSVNPAAEEEHWDVCVASSKSLNQEDLHVGEKTYISSPKSHRPSTVSQMKNNSDKCERRNSLCLGHGESERLSPESLDKIPTIIYESSNKTLAWSNKVDTSKTVLSSDAKKTHSVDVGRKRRDSGKHSSKSIRDIAPNSRTCELQERSDLPPRFQKLNKETNSSNISESTDSKTEPASGGLLKLSAETLHKIDMARSTPSPSSAWENIVPMQNGSVFSGVTRPVLDVNARPKMNVVADGTRSTSFVYPNTMSLYQPYPSPVMAMVPYGEHFGMHAAAHSPRPPMIRAPCTFPYSVNNLFPSSSPMPSAVLNSFTDQLINSDNQGKRVKPLVEKNLNDAGLLERELNSYLNKGLDDIDLKALGHCRWKLQLRYENVILADPRYCAERNVEQALWKISFYQVIESLRRQMDQHPNRAEEIKKAIINLVEEGTVFYENLLEKQQETFGFSLSQFLDSDSVRPRGIPDSVRLVLISAQKLFICLGDLARYREQASGTSNYGKARSWYLKAQQIAPKNGRPYNQLAILALYARRKLDAVYYYMRSLAASNPFLSARESLLSLFDEARKKFELVEKKRCQEGTRRDELREQRRMEKLEERYEVWIHPNGTSSQEKQKVEETNLSDMSTVDLNKRFVLSFLHVHGKLFTKVGMETFTETANQMLEEFQCLIQRTPAPLASVRLLQLLAINMFAVANTSLKDQALEPRCRSLLQEQALQISLAMVAIVLEHSVNLLKEHLASSEYPSQLISDDLAQLLPSIKIWTDWMSSQKALWTPPPAFGDLRTRCKGDVWTVYADFLTLLRTVEIGHVDASLEKKEGYDPINLPEDTMLAGFVPLLGAPQDVYYISQPYNKEHARMYLRVNRIQFFGDYLCGIPDPYLEFEVGNKRFVSLVTTHSDESDEMGRDPPFDLSEEDNLSNDSYKLDEDLSDGSKMGVEEDNEIRSLWSRKEALKRTKERQDKHKAQIQEVLREHRSKRPTMVEVRPRYLLPDTNCFIDHLDELRLVVKSSSFYLVVPLVVINELDGLARGVRDDQYHTVEHHKKVAEISRKAVMFLEERFAHRDPKVRAITSKGSILETISFRSEDVTNSKGTNDDLILSCCLHYCRDVAKEFMPREPNAPLRLFREAVLLTDDRNLRVKAMTHNVPVRDLPAFLRWANIR